MTEFSMQFVLQPYHILLAALIGWANERQQQIIEFQNDQIKAMLKKLGKKRLLLTDDQRRVLAVKGHALGRTALLELTTIVTPDTILRWHRELVSAYRYHLVFCRWSGFFGVIESAQAAFEAVSVSAGGGFAAFLDAVAAD
jgi:hypothetical protein